MAKEIVSSDTLIILSDMTNERLSTAFEITSKTCGIYSLSHNDKQLKLIKNVNAPGWERISNFTIKKLTTDSLVMMDYDGFQYVYLKQVKKWI